MANMYFLILTGMECIPEISDSGGYPVLAFPLAFVVGISMIKDIYEDYTRHRSDAEENNRKVQELERGYLNINPSDDQVDDIKQHDPNESESEVEDSGQLFTNQYWKNV